MNLPKVSVVTITYGHELFIIETIKGVLIQDYEGEIEFIIANDNSPDNTDQIVNDYLSSIIIPDNITINYLKHSSNKGMMSNFIWALQQAQGKYIALCEGDDYWTDPLKLQEQVDILESNDRIGMVYTKCRRSDNGKALGSSLRGNELFWNNKITSLTTLFKRDIMLKYYEVVNVEEKNWLMGDYPMWLWFHINSEIYFLDKITATYRVLPHSASHFADGNKRVLFNINSYEIAKDFAKDFLDEKEYNQLINDRLCFLGLSAIKHRSSVIWEVGDLFLAFKHRNFKSDFFLFFLNILKKIT